MKVIVTDHGFPNLNHECQILGDAGHELVVAQCRTAAEVLEQCADADALLVQWAPITKEVIQALTRCKVIVRYGIGVDNVDIAAASEKGIPICNVPDYCIDEVADHTISLALALARQLPQVDRRTRKGEWKIVPDGVMPAFREMTFATLGCGRIARAVLERAKGFGFRLATYDPYVSNVLGVESLSLDEVIRQADILSLHLPLTAATKHLINEECLRQMKGSAIVVNTARGGLIDTAALAAALRHGTIASAGLDVFEIEPLPADHPLRECDNVLLTSHIAWHSAASVPELQRKAAEEVLRGLRGEALANRVNA